MSALSPLMNAAELLGLSRPKLQQVAKDHGIRANSKTAVIVEELLKKFPDGVPRLEVRTTEVIVKDQLAPTKGRRGEQDGGSLTAEGPHNGDAVEKQTTDGGVTADLPSGTSPRLGVTTRMESAVVEVVDDRELLKSGVAESASPDVVLDKQNTLNGGADQAGSSRERPWKFAPVFSRPSPSKVGTVLAKPADDHSKKPQTWQPVFTPLVPPTHLSARSRLQKRLSLLSEDEEQDVLDDLQKLEKLKNGLHFDMEVIYDLAEQLNKRCVSAQDRMSQMDDTFLSLEKKVYGIPPSQVEEYDGPEEIEDFTVSQVADTTTDAVSSITSLDKGKRKADAEDLEFESPRKRSYTSEASDGGQSGAQS